MSYNPYMNTMAIIKKEYERMNNNPNGNIGVSIGLLNENDFFTWRATMTGPKDTSYKGGIFILIIKFPLDYPYHAPEVCFKTPIYHMNVNPIKSNMPGAEPLGHVCISTLNWWNKDYTMTEVLTNIFGLFYMANPDSPYGTDRAYEYKCNRPLHEEKIKYFTRKYANPSFCNFDKEYYDSWDFSYP